MHATDIVAYTYNVETLCPACMRRVAADVNESSGQNAEFVPLDTLLLRWAQWEGLTVWDEANNEWELASEESYDSGDFPKVVFASQVWGREETETCDQCGEELG